MNNEKNLKHTFLTKLAQLAWLALNVFVLSLIAGTTMYVFASFTEPGEAPASSDQDFAQNILGANNADNEFNSYLVTDNKDGSIIERLEYVQVNALPQNTDYPKMRYQVYDDYNCNGGDNGNNGTNEDACASNDPEYTGEEGQWGSSTDTTLGGALVASGLVKQDMRTGLYWSDCYDSVSGQGSCNIRTNSFATGTGCTDDDVLNGDCDSSKFETKGDAITFCEALSLDADGDGTDETDWRLPTQKELMQAYINGTANNLPNPNYSYWSATEDYSTFAFAWYVGLDRGYTYYGSKTTDLYARCVHR